MVRYFLIILLPFIIGAIGEGIIQDFINSEKKSLLPLLSKYWFVIPLLIIYFLGWLWQKFSGYQKRHLNRLYSSLEWFHDEMGLGDIVDADIRCTIWAPINIREGATPIRLKQIVPYVPKRSQINDKTFRDNGRPGRIYDFTENKDDNIVAIGIVGQCAIDSISKCEPGIYHEEVPDDINFIEYMVENWNFSESRAMSLSSNRRSYLCLSMMDAGQSDLLGIIYLDSCDPKALVKSTGTHAQKYLPRIARVLTE